MDMQWLKNDFIGYLDGWEALLNSNEELEKAAKQKMCLSRKNLEGYRITGMELFYVQSYTLYS